VWVGEGLWVRERRGNEANDRGLCCGRFDANFLRDIGLVGWDIEDWLGYCGLVGWDRLGYWFGYWGLMGYWGLIGILAIGWDIGLVAILDWLGLIGILVWLG